MLLTAAFWEVNLGKKREKGWIFLLQSSWELSFKSKTVCTEMTWKQTACGLFLCVSHTDQLQVNELPETNAVCCLKKRTNIACNIHISFNACPVLCQISFPGGMQDKVFVAFVSGGRRGGGKMSIIRCVLLRVGELEMSQEELWRSFPFSLPLSSAFSCH